MSNAVMYERKCQNCGAPLKFGTLPDGVRTWKCEYCGSVFTQKADHIVLIQDQQARVLASEVRIPSYMMQYGANEESLAKYAKDRLVHSLAEGLSDFMEIRMDRHNPDFDTVIRGYVRVIPPDFRY